VSLRGARLFLHSHHTSVSMPPPIFNQKPRGKRCLGVFDTMDKTIQAYQPFSAVAFEF
jgi:hypothetical protein